LLVVGGWAIDPAGDLAPAWCDGLERALILFGVLVIAASPYLWPGANPEPPERFSRSVSAPAVAVAGCAASAQLALYGSVPDHVFHGLVMLALTGAFFRIQPRTVE
ncbi:MAG TPA: hypothetical protein PKA64_24465, partial [Myxococcota bacterium]|nr:hypothetical protein [Myxococcota bacterium]